MKDQAARQNKEGERRRRIPRPLDRASLDELALAYVARFATSRAKLSFYLRRKLRERGWVENEEPADLDAVADRLVRLGFVDDRAFAQAKAEGLTRRGFGERRVRSALGAAGIGKADQEGALDTAAGQAWQSALRFAERRRLGPFATGLADAKTEARALSAMIRAGHDFTLSRRIIAAAPGEVPDAP